MNGNIAALWMNLFSLSVSIAVDFVYNLSYSREYLLVCKDFFGAVYEQDVRSWTFKVPFLPAVALADAAFKKIPLYCPLEILLGDRHHHPVESVPGFQEAIAYPARHISETTPGKKS